MSAQALDGYDINPREIGRPTIERPFSLNGDFDALVVRRRFKHLAELFAPAPLLSPDAAHPEAYMVHPGDPGETETGPIWFERTYATVPGDQVSVGSRVITKPAPQSNFSFSLSAGSVLVASGGVEYNQHLWINSLVYGPIRAVTSASNGLGGTRINCPGGHGLAGSEEVVIRANSLNWMRLSPSDYAVVDANNFDYLGGLLTGIIYFAKRLRAYTPGTSRVGVRLTQRFYLPGITPGIATASDIPIPGTLINEADFLAAVLANTAGFVAYDASELTKWNGWAIYTQTFTEVNFGTI